MPETTAGGSFSSIATYPWKDKYLARCATWDWHNAESIDILDNDNRVVSTLGLWQTLVFHEADGNRTAKELISWLRTQYRTEPAPPDLDETILKTLKDLIEDLKVVEIWDRPDDLAYYFEWPRKEQDETEAMRSMKEDGLIT